MLGASANKPELNNLPRQDITMLSYSPALAVPFVTFEEYSSATWIPKRTIETYVKEGRIIIKKKQAPKEKPLFNLVAMNELAAREAIELLGGMGVSSLIPTKEHCPL